jgi:hypothetical protein
MSQTLFPRARRLLADFVASGWSDVKTLSLSTGGTRGLRANLGGLDRSRGSIGDDEEYLFYGNPSAPPDVVTPLRNRLLHLLDDARDAGLHLFEVSIHHHFVLSPTRLSLAARPTDHRHTRAADRLLNVLLAQNQPLRPHDAMLVLPPHLSGHARLAAIAHADAWLAARGRRISAIASTHLVYDPQAVVQARHLVARGPLDDSYLWCVFDLR